MCNECNNVFKGSGKTKSVIKFLPNCKHHGGKNNKSSSSNQLQSINEGKQ